MRMTGTTVPDMSRSSIQQLVQLNNAFYAQNFASFSATRQKPWQGWEQGVRILREHLEEQSCSPRILDFAAGNLRFERYLLEINFAKAGDMLALDVCADLMRSAGEDLGVRTQEMDIIAQLLAGKTLFAPQQSNSAAGLSPDFAPDIVCSFGFLHHIPSRLLRQRFLQCLVEATKPGGYIFISLWDFADAPASNTCTKAEAYTKRYFEEHPQAARKIQLEVDDYLLGWKNQSDAFRYCHSFSVQEVERIIREISPRASKIAQFTADGGQNQSNHYVILRRTL